MALSHKIFVFIIGLQLYAIFFIGLEIQLPIGFHGSILSRPPVGIPL